MKSLYLYCVRAASLNCPKTDFVRKGAINDSGVFTIPYKDLEAVVSEIDLDEFSEADIAEKAREDVRWITREAQKHQHVLEEAMKIGVVIPMHFGTIFKSLKTFRTMIKKRHIEFFKILQKLKNKVEWSVKVYAREKQFIEKVTKKNPELRNQAKKVSSSELGDDYFEAITLEQKSNDTIAHELDIMSQSFFDTLKKKSHRAHVNRTLHREFLKQLGVQNIQEEDLQMILNSAYLLGPDDKKIFIRTIEKLQKKNPEFVFSHTGPWPPFNFV